MRLIKGFTLAETLITLMIIGVVAVLVVPRFIENYQARARVTAAKVFTKQLNEAFQRLNTEGKFSGHKTTGEFMEALSKHMTFTKICDNDNLEQCFTKSIMASIYNLDEDIFIPENTTDIVTKKTAKSIGLDWDSYNMTAVLPNGINLLLTYKPDCEETHTSSVFSGTGCVGAVFDLNSDKGPNKIGEDIITYGNVLISGVMIFNGKKWKLPFYTQGVSYQECLELKSQGMVRGCYIGLKVDYWADAAKQCGGYKNLPSKADLDALAEKLYPGVSILKDQYVTTYCPDKQKCINSEKAKAILSTFGVEANGFTLWSNLEDSTPRAGFRYFGDNNTYWYYNSSSGTKAKSDVLTVCLYE